MKKHDQIRKMMEEISDIHIKEAADLLSGEQQIPEQKTKTHRRNSWLWAGLAAAGIVALLGAATVKLNRNAEQLQAGSQGMTESAEPQDMMSEENAEQLQAESQGMTERAEPQDMVSEENNAESLSEDGFDIATEDGETIHADTHIYTSNEIENAVIIRDYVDGGGTKIQIWYADLGYGMYRGIQSEGAGMWCHFQMNDDISNEIYKTNPYLHFMKNIDGVLYNMEFWSSYEDGEASMLVTITNSGKELGDDRTGSKKIDFGYDISDTGALNINGISAEELQDFLEPIYEFADGADLVFVRGPRGICPAEEQPDLSDGYTKLSMVLPIVSEEYYNEFLSRYGTLQEQLSALITGEGM